MDGEIKAKIKTIPLARTEVSSTVELIGKDIKELKDSINKTNSDIIDAHNEINTLRRENKALSNKLADSRSRIVILEENYNSIVEDLTQSAKIDLAIYTIFAMCIFILGYYVYILIH